MDSNTVTERVIWWYSSQMPKQPGLDQLKLQAKNSGQISHEAAWTQARGSSRSSRRWKRAGRTEQRHRDMDADISNSAAIAPVSPATALKQLVL